MATLFRVSRETIRGWSNEFGDYLSRDATPGEGRTRQFNDDDVRVFALVAEMKEAKMQYADIHAALQNGQRADPPANATALVSNYDERRLAGLEKQIGDLRSQLVDIRKERDSALAKIEAYKEVAEERKAETERLRLDTQHTIGELQREIGKLTALLEMEREKNKDEEEN